MPLGVRHQDFICVSKADVGVRFSPPHTHFFSGLPWRRVLRSCCCQVCNDNARQSHASHRHTYGHTHTHSLRRTVNKSTLYAFLSPTQSPSEHSWACPCRLGPVILKHITCLYRDRGNFLRNLTLICPPQKKSTPSDTVIYFFLLFLHGQQYFKRCFHEVTRHSSVFTSSNPNRFPPVLVPKDDFVFSSRDEYKPQKKKRRRKWLQWSICYN